MSDRRDDETVQTHAPSSEDGGGRGSRPSIPGKLGRYTIVRLLGRGGVGAVYEAEDPELGRRVAIKVLREDRAGDMEGLKREAQALARLVHPNVVTVHDVGVADDDVFIVMQLVVGETIDLWLRARHAGAAEIVQAFLQAGEGLVAAHAAGLVHCDFKPANVLVDRQGVVRVGDFGLARATRGLTSIAPGAAITAMAGMTTIAGTPAYMAPEQFEGVVTAASDQFAFCVALWEVLAGERPFEDSSVAAGALDVRSRGPRRVLRRDLKIPPHVARVLERGIAEDPADRFASMQALLAALQPPSRRRPALIAAGLALAATGVIVALASRSDHDGPRAAAWDGADVAASHPLTGFGDRACAYAPAFEPGGRSVVFDRTEGDAVDLYEVPLAGGEARQLTSGALWEWRAQPGRRAGEMVHLIHDPKRSTGAQIAYLDLASRTETTALAVYAWDAIVLGEALYYTPDEPSAIRRLDGKQDTLFVQPPAGQVFVLLAGSPTGDRLVATSSNTNDGPTYPCVVEAATGKLDCLATQSAPSRPAFGADGKALYYNARDGIRRRELATGIETLVVKGVWSEGGMAIARDGSALVYSLCYAHSQIVDAATAKVVIDDGTATQPTMSTTGALAWVRDVSGINVLMVRMPDGRELQLTSLELGSVRTPAFSLDGERLAFGVSGPSAGLYTMKLALPGAVNQLTDGKRDVGPTWTANGKIGFTRGDANANDQAYVASLDPTVPLQRLGPGTRTVYGSRGNELLIGDEESQAMYWIDVETGRTRTGPPRPRGYLTAAAVSPRGTWVVYQLGANGQDLWRVSTDAAGALEHVVSYGAAQTVSQPAITDDGHVLASPSRWLGDLVIVPARPGARF